MRSLAWMGLVALVAAGCGSEGGPGASATATATATSTTASTATSAPKPKEMPSITVDELGPYVGGERARLKEAGGGEKLTRVVKELPIDGKEVEVVVLKKAKATDVVALVRELGAAGAPTVKVRFDGRNDVPKEIVITPQSKMTEKVPGCTVVAMVSKDLSTSVWAVAGGIGKKHTKGFAGPDLTNTGETLKKELEKCDASVAYFSVDEAHEWELAHNLAGTMRVADVAKKVQKLVVLDEPPVAGRPVKTQP